MTASSRSLLFLAILLCIQPTAVMGAQLAGSGDVLQMLKKIQGRWQSECFADEFGRYKQETLTFSFTHVQFIVLEYPSNSCLKEVSRHSAKYQFILGDALESDDGRLGYAIDFVYDHKLSGAAALPKRNIIHYSNGALFLGKASSPVNQLSQNDEKRMNDPESFPVAESTTNKKLKQTRLGRFDDGKPFRR